MHTLLITLLLACGSSGRTVAELEAAKSEVKPFQKWEEAEGKLKAALGDPDSEKDQASTWVGKDGDECKALTVSHIGGTVGTVTLTTSDCPS